MRNIAISYLDMLGKLMVRRDREAEDHVKKSSHAEIYDHDLTAAIRLLERGYDIKSVTSVIREKSPMAKQLSDTRAMMLYTEKVMEAINEHWAERAEGTLQEAKESYLRRLTAQEDTMQRDYRIGLAMIRQDGFPLPIVRQVIEQSAARREDESYLRTLLFALSAGQERYAAIQNYCAARMNSETDVYRKFAHDYMDEKKSLVLTDHDEENIIERIYREYLRKYRNGEPDRQQHPKQILRILEKNVDPIMRKCIVMASPLYSEHIEGCNQRLIDLLSVVKDQILVHRENESDRSSIEEKLSVHENIREQEKLSHYVVIPRSNMREDLASEYQYQRKKIEGAIRLPYNITMEVKIVKALLNNGVESKHLIPLLSRCKPENWEQEHPNLSYPSYILKQIEKEAREKDQIQERSLVRTRQTKNTSGNT